MNFIILFSTLILFSAAPFGTSITKKNLYQDQQIIKKADWLVGTWVNETTRGPIYESWSIRDANSLFGKSYTVNKSDTTVFEHITIRQSGNQLFYIPRVMDQNNGQPVSFKATKISSNQLIFENPKHDFPQTISYHQINRDSLMAEISGRVEGQIKKRQFPMRRVD